MNIVVHVIDPNTN